MCCRGKLIALPVLALLLAGGALLGENLSAEADEPAVATTAPPAAPTADADTPKSVAEWTETGNVRKPPPPKAAVRPQVHIVRP